MKRLLALMLVAMATGASLSACNFVADLAQFDNASLAPGDAAALPVDATTTSGDGAVAIDGAAVVDGQGVGPDADAGASDAAKAFDAEAGTTWCALHSTAVTGFCKDFDEGTNYLAGWSSNYSTPFFPMGAIDSTNSAPDSPPNSLLITTPLLEAGAPAAQELLTTNITATRGIIDLKLALMMENFDQGAQDVSLFRIAYLTPNPNATSPWWISLDLAQSAAQLLETISATDGGLPMNPSNPVPQPTPSVWVNVELVINTVAQTATLSYDGVLVPGTPFSISNPPQNSAGFSVQIGMNYLMGPAHSMQFWYDNLLIDLP